MAVVATGLSTAAHRWLYSAGTGAKNRVAKKGQPVAFSGGRTRICGGDGCRREARGWLAMLLVIAGIGELEQRGPVWQ